MKTQFLKPMKRFPQFQYDTEVCNICTIKDISFARKGTQD